MTFESFFEAATQGRRPYEYQRRLAEGNLVESHNRSTLVTVPTGMGKTAAAVLAWLWNRVGHPDPGHRAAWPRRLVYCLPMRTLVEQTAASIGTWLKALELHPAAAAMDEQQRQQMKWMAAHYPAILMAGQEKSDWDLYPERPAILVGTQDMLLSRALNRGYGVTRFRWPLHFGLLNNDCLWIMDEVQLMGPALWTSGQLDWMRDKRFKPVSPSYTWWMSATQSSGFLATPDRKDLPPPLRLAFDPAQTPPALAQAKRPCQFWKPPRKLADPEAFLPSLAQAITQDHQPGALTLVVCNTVLIAQQLHSLIDDLKPLNLRSILLTARMRGLDRKRNEQDLIAFEADRKSGAANGGPGMICVATQVVEAGLDVSACRLWSEIAPWTSIVQRLGRLNRDGTANLLARAFWIELPKVKDDRTKPDHVGPYLAADVKQSQRLTQKLCDLYRHQPNLPAEAALALIRENPDSADDFAAALKPAPVPFPRAIDLHGLFSTEPDLAGGFTDVSAFIRDSDPDPDTFVIWREFNPTLLPSGDELDGPAYSADEACHVPVFQLRAFLSRTRTAAYVWNDRRHLGQARRANEVVPGMVVMLPCTAGGYLATQGWTADAKHHLGSAPPPGPFDDGDAGDPTSTARGCWTGLDEHLSDVGRTAATISAALDLDPSLRDSLVTAAAFHDIGKALPAWQAELPHPAPIPGRTWAKAPFLLAVKPKSGTAAASVEAVLSNAGVIFRPGDPDQLPRTHGCLVWHTNQKGRDTADGDWLTQIRALDPVEAASMVQFRPGLRHEAASALALWHQYFQQSAAFPGLTVYLAMAHHGKVRTILSSRPSRGKRELENVCGIPSTTISLPWNGTMPINGACAADGSSGEFSPDGEWFSPGEPSWSALVADLLGDWRQNAALPAPLALRDSREPRQLGPFALAFLECLLVCADVRASRDPTHRIPANGILS